MLVERIKNPSGWDSSFNLSLFNSYLLPDVKFGGNCLINSNISVFRKVISLYISYKVDTWSRYLNTDFTLGTYLFGTAKSTKNTDSNQYGYNYYGIGFNALSKNGEKCHYFWSW